MVKASFSIMLLSILRMAAQVYSQISVEFLVEKNEGIFGKYILYFKLHLHN